MATTNYFLIALILAGAIIMLGAITHTRRILKEFAQQDFYKKWRLLYVLNLFFFLGYIGVIYIVVTGQESILLVLTGVIFFFGAVFVYIVALTGLHSFKALKISNDELGALVIKLRAQNDQLEQFNYATSHDLREPLNTMVAFTELIQTDYADKLGPDGIKYLQYTTQAAQRMRELVDSLMMYLKVGQNDYRVETNLDVLLADVSREMAGSINSSGASVGYHGLPTLPVNDHEIKRLFQNLISNAIKYRKPDTPPEIGIAAWRGGANQWIFAVDDNGIGIAEADREKVFQIFKQLHVRGQYEGVGLGLAMCKKIVEMHGGNIWVEPSTTGGTRVCFSLREHT
jgi:light-regulated signal transduction histidine kinase (bacteriophytochrome)